MPTAVSPVESPVDPVVALEAMRPSLVGFCYRMLGSAFEADDAVQETMIRAWRGFERFEGRAPFEAWIFRIATNVCLSMLRGRQRRALPVDLGPASTPSTRPDQAPHSRPWVGPMADAATDVVGADPAEVAAQRESLRLAFVAALQLLPARQRAVLILRDVLRWRTDEVATLLDTTPVSVKSALQRARATLATERRRGLGTGQGALEDAQLASRYVRAFELHDVEALVSLLRDGATMSMPPAALWLNGRRDIAAWWATFGGECNGSTLLPIEVNGGVGFAHYRPSEAGIAPFAVHVVTTAATQITAIDVYVEPDLFRLFGLPDQPPVPNSRRARSSKSAIAAK